MFAVLRQRDTPFSNLARVLAGWLAVILLVQAQAALQALVLGSAHRHMPVPEAAADAGPRLAGKTLPVAHESGHRVAHERGEPHHHVAGEVALPADAEAALDAAAFALIALLLPLVASVAWPQRTSREAPLARASWAFLNRTTEPPRRPPRG